ncbi:MAG: nickel pincer cofactor biosynthesis protein LarB [Candidatus Margulisiibacteriota bacterium]
MDIKQLKKILAGIKSNSISADEALNLLRSLPYKNMGFARVDHHRQIRKGFPEVIFCSGKTIEQIKKIALSQHDVLATRADEKTFIELKKVLPLARFHKEAGIISVSNSKRKVRAKNKKAIVIVTAGTADIPVAEEAAVTAEFLGNNVKRIYDVGVAGIHRLFDKTKDIMSAPVIIVIAGMDGALASVVGGLVSCPVIAVPTSIGYGSNFKGLSALLSMLNSCATGVGVVNIDNGFGAACLANAIMKRK